MAKPGSDAVRQIAASGAVDLSKRPVQHASPEVAELVRRAAEGQLGMRCAGCHERITIGFQFTRIDVLVGASGRPEVDVQRLAACNGANGCDFAEEAKDGAHAMEMIEFAWLDGGENSAGAVASLDDERAARAGEPE